jgi:lysophospholipase L1-like esterase
MNRSTRLAVLLAALLSASPVFAAQWVTSWAASPLPPAPGMGPLPGTPSFDNQTIRQVLRLSAGGSRLRLKLTNEYGTAPLRIAAATVSLVAEDGKLGPVLPLSFAGQKAVVIPAGAPLLSDPLQLPVGARARLSVSLYLPEPTGPCTCHSVGVQDAFVSGPGDYTAASFTADHTVQMRAFVSGVEVQSARGRTIVVLGDSISDGVGSTVNTDHRWPDLLAARLAARKDGSSWGVANQGISGNRVLDGGAGESALSRFDRDVLGQAGVTHVILFLGVNDLGISFGNVTEGPMAQYFRALIPKEKATAQRIIAGYQQLIARAHAHGIKIYGATIAPYEGASYWSAAGESERAAINQWIRTGAAFDAVLDFDAVLRDPTLQTRIRESYQAGDHLHGSDAGYAALANSVDLALFK